MAKLPQLSSRSDEFNKFNWLNYFDGFRQFDEFDEKAQQPDRPTTKSCHLLELPPELRNYIYDLVFSSDANLDGTFEIRRGRCHPSTNILALSRQIRSEAIGLYYGQRLCSKGCISCIDLFRRLADDSRPRVSSWTLILPAFPEYDFDGVMEAIKGLPNFKKLCLHFPRMTDFDLFFELSGQKALGSTTGRRFRVRTLVSKNAKLEALLKLRGLEVFRITCGHQTTGKHQVKREKADVVKIKKVEEGIAEIVTEPRPMSRDNQIHTTK